MSNYITKTDYKYQIRTDVFDQILEEAEEDEDAMLDQAEGEGIAFVRNFLENRYDLNTEFAKSGSDRHKVLLRMCKVVVLYLIYERIPDDLVPERIVKNYEATLKMLKEVQNGSADLPGLSVKNITNEDGETKPSTKRRWGSVPKRVNDALNPRNLKY